MIYITEVDCRNKKGKYVKGAKITNVGFADKNEILISSNDSRLRLVNLVNYQRKMKYKCQGYINEKHNIYASFKLTCVLFAFIFLVMKEI